MQVYKVGNTSILYEKEADDNQDDSSYNLPKFHASTDIKDTENACANTEEFCYGLVNCQSRRLLPKVFQGR